MGKILKVLIKKLKRTVILLKSNSKFLWLKHLHELAILMLILTQAKGVPGTAVINFVDNITLEKNTYYLNFDVQSTSDEFNSAICW